jgi:thiosulfate/3-mercaptopyruvate sulfurtransferase
MNIRTLVDVQQLHALAVDGAALIVDCRVDLSDRARGGLEYRAGHIPGAVFADLNRDLSDLTNKSAGGHPLPDAEAFSNVLAGWGWIPGRPIVAYDEANGSLAAARLWWMLRLVGHRDAAILDGGLAAWKTAGLALTSERRELPRSEVDVRFDRGQIVGTDELLQAKGQAHVLLVDARAFARFRGEVEPLDAVAGHVPGARNRPFSDNLDNGQLKPAAVLRQEFESLLAGVAADHVVLMCGSGVTACLNLLAMEHAGLSGSRVYAASWSGWISDPARPTAVGPA